MQADLLVDSFCNLRVRLQGSEADGERYREIVAPVIKHLDMRYWAGNQDFSRISLLGSWQRGTAVLGLSDFNIAYEMPKKDLPDFSQMGSGRDLFLEGFHREVLKAFPSAERHDSRHSVTVPLSKGRVVDVRPFFWMKSGDMGYPDLTLFSNWHRFEPMVACDALLRLDPMERENVLMICRVARIWRAVHSVPLSGVLIDALALQFIAKAAHRRKPSKYQDCLMRDFFGFIADQDPEADWWTIPGAEEPVLRSGRFEELAASAHRVAQYAIEQAASRQEKSARAAWRYLLGEYYPPV